MAAATVTQELLVKQEIPVWFLKQFFRQLGASFEGVQETWGLVPSGNLALFRPHGQRTVVSIPLAVFADVERAATLVKTRLILLKVGQCSC